MSLLSPERVAAEAEAEAEVAAGAAEAVGLLRFAVGAVVVAGVAEEVVVAGMAEEVCTMGLLPMVAWPAWVMGGVAMH
jgi:hypothetical protein